jgi:GAF domain-containing protein
VSVPFLSAEDERLALLQSVVDLTRTVFKARACSVMRHDVSSRELIFEAVSGEGQGSLAGQRIPATTGIAGWAVAAEEPIAIADTRSDTRFDRDFAEQTGFVPERLIAFPLLDGERAIGVIEVLDPQVRERDSVDDMNVLASIAVHAAAVLTLVQAARAAADPERPPSPLNALERALQDGAPAQREAALALVSALETLLKTTG